MKGINSGDFFPVENPVAKTEITKRWPPLPIEVNEEEGSVFILETKINLNKENKNFKHTKDFTHFALDRHTLDTIEKIATAVDLKDPCLLEGETATSKTSSIEYLADLTRNEVVRLNLNGQTDSSELIGKFIPNDGSVQIDFEKAMSNPALLTQDSQEIIKKANSEGRGLNLLESQKIAQLESIEAPDWRWLNGVIPSAMINGQWVILDEINLAEPQILERINSVIERDPTLVISENGNQKIGNGGENQTNPNFRIFATMNPAEYTGR